MTKNMFPIAATFGVTQIQSDYVGVTVELVTVGKTPVDPALQVLRFALSISQLAQLGQDLQRIAASAPKPQGPVN